MQDQLISWRRDLHQIPEVGLELPKTSAYVAEKLSEMGIEYQENIGVSGIVGLIKGKEDGKTIAIRADMDGLAIVEETGLPFASTNGNMHACGHDAHTAMLLGAAKILNENKDKLKGNIKLIFQAGEEGPGGAKPMIDDGAMENPKVDAVLGLHIGIIFKEIGTGEVGVAYGNLMACLDRFEIKVIGKGCHGAMPDTGVDPIVISAEIINALQTIISREIKPTEPAVITIGQINGGRSYNIIPDSVEIIGTARAISQAVREKIASRMEEIVANVTKGMRGDYEFTYTYGYPPLVNDAEFTKGFAETAKKVVGKENVVEIARPTMGGEDMAYFLEKAPGTFFFLGGGNEAKGIVAPHHNSKFDVDEDVFWKGTTLLAQGAVDWLAKEVPL
ncbi:amidohydrolase [Candidatus Atribacteria bacterium 1244-E10-H5-B2]|nr:MAG: amidohydrolase [Candidatus Atribacteria bacterium 1244-E10-H5-B2]